MAEDISDQPSPEELREFMQGDWTPVEADPAFVQRLRSRLWDMLQAKLNGSGAVPGRNRANPAPIDPPASPKTLR